MIKLFSRFNVFIFVLLGVLIFLQYRLWFEAGGIYDMLHLQKALSAQVEKNKMLKKSNNELLFQIRRLQNDQGATEARARNELGMIKKDETFYQIVK